MKYYYGTETKKAISSFSSDSTPFEFIRAYGEVKKAVVLAQQECFSIYKDDFFPFLIDSIDEIISGMHIEQFPLPLKQGGAGTSVHMNINEVITNLANEKYDSQIYKIDSLEHLAKFQSTNDTFSTALTVMVYRELESIESLIIKLQELLVLKETEYDQILITGRTELQDALPMTLGQVFAGWAGSIERDRWRLNKLKERVRTISLGGTAIGTCFSAPKKYVHKAEKNLRQITGLPLCRNQNLPDEISNKDILAEVASGFQLISQNLRKIVGDLLLYTSSFCRELIHPELQYGSSIMPYKTNPVLLEYVKGLTIDIKYECLKVSEYTTEGQMQLNPFTPFITASFIQINQMMGKALKSLIYDFFPKMKVNRNRINENLLSSPALINTLRQVIGYNNVKKLVPVITKEKPDSLKNLITIISENSSLSIDFLEKWFDPSNLTSYTNSTFGDKNGNSFS